VRFQSPFDDKQAHGDALSPSEGVDTCINFRAEVKSSLPLFSVTSGFKGK
jgi:hypothetical protein